MSDKFTMPRRVLFDAKTGREVWQVTDGEFECVAPYMDVKAWARADKYLVFMSNRSGSWQPYRLEIESGEATRLSSYDFYAGYRSVALDATHGVAYCQDGRKVIAVDLETLETRLAVDYTARLGRVGDWGNFKGQGGNLNADGTLVALAGMSNTAANGMDTVLLIAPTDGSNAIEEIPLPRSDLRVGHILFCLGDDNLLSFHGNPDRQNDIQERPENRVAYWCIERHSRKMKPLVLVPPGYRALHGLWGVSGNRFYFHRKTVPGFNPSALGSVDRNGQAMNIYYESSSWRLGHSAPSPDEKWIVTDSADIDENILMLVSTQRDEQHMLCWPNMSQKGSQRTHRRSPRLPPHDDVDTHPRFSETGRYVHYASDISGRTQIYVVPVEDLVSH